MHDSKAADHDVEPVYFRDFIHRTCLEFLQHPSEENKNIHNVFQLVARKLKLSPKLVEQVFFEIVNSELQPEGNDSLAKSR